MQYFNVNTNSDHLDMNCNALSYFIFTNQSIYAICMISNSILILVV